MKNELVVSHKLKKNGFRVRLSDPGTFSVNYPSKFLENLKTSTQHTLINNFIYCRTRPLSLYFPNLLFQGQKPQFKNLIDYGIREDLPRVCFWGKKSTKELLKKFNKSKSEFNNQLASEKMPPSRRCSNKKTILSMSFGKDSLLSYALAQEIGLEMELAFVNDMAKYNPRELKIKKKIIKEFSKEQKKKIYYIEDDSDNIYRNKKSEMIPDLDGTNAMLAFALELIPLAYHFRAKYIMFGNEKNLDDYYINREKFKVYPSFDQSISFMEKENRYLKRMTGGNIQVISLIKPLYNFAEVKILYSRYPHLLKYLMSCASKKLSHDKWCYGCVACAWAFLYAKALGHDPKVAGINKNLFEGKYRRFFALFSNKSRQLYEKPPQVREEQLLAFLLAFRNGVKGELIDLFKKNYLKEAEEREKELRQKFFGIHSVAGIPKQYQNKLLKIFREELEHLT